MPFSRRELFNNAGFGLLLLPALLRSPQTILRHLLFDPEGPLVSPKPIPINPLMREGRSLVAIIYGTEPGRMLRRALELLGGIDRLGLRGHRVLLKPNVLNDQPPPSTTNPLVVKAMAEEGRISVRNARRSGRHELEAFEKDGDLSEDELARAEKELDKLTHAAEAEIDVALGQKERELLED